MRGSHKTGRIGKKRMFNVVDETYLYHHLYI
jgi:hypothetical protein